MTRGVTRVTSAVLPPVVTSTEPSVVTATMSAAPTVKLPAPLCSADQGPPSPVTTMPSVSILCERRQVGG